MSEQAPTELAAENYGDPNVDMMAEMDKFFEQEAVGQTPEPPNKPVEQPPVAKEAVETTQGEKTAETPPDASQTDTLEDEPLIDEEFFSDTKKDEPVKEPVKEGDFDEEAFDKQTEEEVKGMEQKAGEKFRALKAELKAAKQLAISPEVQAKLDAAELRAQEAEGLKARLAEVSAQSAKLQVENEPEYQEQVVQPAADLFARADALAEMYEAEPAILRAIIKERDRKTQNELIAEHLKDFSDFDRSEAYRMIQDFNGLVGKRETMLAKAEETLERNKTARLQAQEQTLKEQRLAVQTRQKELWNKYKERIPGFVENGEDSSQLKKLMADSMAIDFSQAKASDQAFAAFSGVVLPHALQQLAMMRKRLSVYEKEEVGAIKKAPGAGASVQATPSGDKAPEDFMTAMGKDYSFTH